MTEESKLTADTTGNQDGEGIFIQTNQLIIQEGSQVSASAIEESTGKSGGIQVNALEFIEVIGISSSGSNESSLFALIESGSTVNGGTLTINTQRLIVTEGAERGSYFSEL